MKVLVTGAGALLGQGIIRSIRWGLPNCEIVGIDPEPTSAGLFWCDFAYQGRMASDKDFLPNLSWILNREQPDVLIPGTDVELSILAQHRAALESETGCTVLVGPPEAIRIADDKLSTSDFFRESGFAFPATARIGDRARTRELVESLGFPLIAKPRIGARSVGLRRISNQEDLDRAENSGADLVLQELIGTDDQEYTAGGLYVDGCCRGTIVMRRTLRDGNTYRACVETDAGLNRSVHAWCEALESFGPTNFQFRLRPDGTPVVFEINARFSGTTPLRARAGFNEVKMMIEHIVHGTPVVPAPIQPLILLRHWSEIAVTAEQVEAVRWLG